MNVILFLLAIALSVLQLTDCDYPIWYLQTIPEGLPQKRAINVFIGLLPAIVNLFFKQFVWLFFLIT